MITKVVCIEILSLATYNLEITIDNCTQNHIPMSTPAPVQKPKLTGWAQAASRAIPKQSLLKNQQQTVIVKAPTPTQKSHQERRSGNESSASTSPTSSVSGQPKKQRPYNRDEVREYMQSLFKEQSRNAKTYKQVLKETQQGDLTETSDWGTVTNKNTRNKKYGTLAEIARVLRN